MAEHWWQLRWTTNWFGGWDFYKCIKCRDYGWHKKDKDSKLFTVHDCPRDDVK